MWIIIITIHKVVLRTKWLFYTNSLDLCCAYRNPLLLKLRENLHHDIISVWCNHLKCIISYCTHLVGHPPLFSSKTFVTLQNKTPEGLVSHSVFCSSPSNYNVFINAGHFLYLLISFNDQFPTIRNDLGREAEWRILLLACLQCVN